MLRFGKKIPLPSTLQIRHELRLMAAADAMFEEARSAFAGVVLSAKQVRDLAVELGSKHGVSSEGAQALVGLVAARSTRRVTVASHPG